MYFFMCETNFNVIKYNAFIILLCYIILIFFLSIQQYFLFDLSVLIILFRIYTL